jgi:hypothetical protein
MNRFKVGQYYENEGATVPSYKYLKITAVYSASIEYDYLTKDLTPNGKEGSCQKGGQWASGFKRINKAGKRTKNVNEDKFYLCWVPDSHLPPRVMQPTLKEAENGAEYLINDKGVDKVYILKVVEVIQKPKPKLKVTKVKF